MATRTQKAAMKEKAAAAKKEKAKAAKTVKSTPAGGKPAARQAAKTASRSSPKKGRVSKGTKRTKAAKPSRASEPATPLATERTSLAERFWHRLGMRARVKEEEAHQHEAEREAVERAALQMAEEEDRRIEREHAAAQRRKAAAAAREMQRIAREEESRMKQEAKQARADRARQAREARKQAEHERAERRRAARGRSTRSVPAVPEVPDDAVVSFEEIPAEAPVVPKPVPKHAPKPSRKPAPKPSRKPAPKPASKPVPEPAPAQSPSAMPRVVAPPKDEVEAQADRFAAEMAARRSKPIQIDAEEDAVPVLPVGRRAAPAEPKEVLTLDPAPPVHIETAPRGLSVPEQFLLLTLEGTWDERRERDKPGGLGGALAGALLLDLLVQGKVRVQRDRFQLTGAQVDDAAAMVAEKLALWPDRPSLQVMQELAKWIPQLLPVYKRRMAARGLLESTQWRHLGLFYRSQTALLDVEAQERLRNKLGRAIAGGGRPDAPTILALGLLEASGLFGLVVPEGAQAYNRKRLNGLLAGKDVMGYKVDDELRGMQEIAVRTILDNVRRMTH